MKNKRRNGKVLIKNIVILFIILSVLGTLMTFSNAKEEISISEYTVVQNDTLWDIASKICEDSDRDDLNIKKVIKQIKKINSLDSNNIYSGQTIELPVY